MRQVICKQDELGPGQMLTVMKGKAPIVVARSGTGRYYAIRGVCPHQGARLDKGQLTSLTISEEPGVYELARDMEILRCPWHSFDYDIVSGNCVSDPNLRIKTYPVYIEEGRVVVDI